MADVFILSAVRTLIGKFGGSMMSLTAVDMGVIAAKVHWSAAECMPSRLGRQFSAMPGGGRPAKSCATNLDP
jgi:acetyl-CoA acetyltransferase